MGLAIAALVFLGIVAMTVGLWWVAEARRTVRQRLGGAATSPAAPAGLLRTDAVTPASGWRSRLVGTDLGGRLTVLLEQSGLRGSTANLLLVIGLFGLAGGVAAWMRVGSPFWALLGSAIGGLLPIAYLVYRRSKRFHMFEQQFPDALDAMARSIRAGNALGSSIQLVGEEMPDPVGQEFRQVHEEIRLGLDPGEALVRLRRRVPTEDVNFFCAAIKIQRGAGGNLAEILDRLSEVIRERYKLLSHARVLSAQHRYTAIFVGLSPVGFAVIFQLMHPGYFDLLLTSPVGPLLIGAGILFEAVGFFTIWRIARIEV